MGWEIALGLVSALAAVIPTLVTIWKNRDDRAQRLTRRLAEEDVRDAKESMARVDAVNGVQRPQ